MVRDSSVCRSVIYPGVFKRIQREKANAAEVECANLAFHRKITRIALAVIIPCARIVDFVDVKARDIVKTYLSERRCRVFFFFFFFFSRPRKRGRRGKE